MWQTDGQKICLCLPLACLAVLKLQQSVCPGRIQLKTVRRMELDLHWRSKVSPHMDFFGMASATNSECW